MRQKNWGSLIHNLEEKIQLHKTSTIAQSRVQELEIELDKASTATQLRVQELEKRSSSFEWRIG